MSGADGGPDQQVADHQAGHPRRVLVTGASGFLGARTLAPLQAAGFEVHALSRRPPQTSGGVSWHAVDLLDDRTTAALVTELAADHMLHLAWYTEHGRFWTAPENLDWAAASLRLLRAFAEAGGRRAVVAGTCAEYDWTTSTQGRCRELDDDRGPATPLRPGTLYGASKHATRLLAEAYAREVGLSLAWGRVFLLYGPGEDERRLIPQVARSLIAGATAETSDGTQVRDLMHVDDVARGFAALLDSAIEGPVNVASGEAVTLARVIELVASESGRPELLRLGALPRREGEPAELLADTRRLREEVGFTPGVELEAGIAEAVAWWRARSQGGPA